MLVTTSRFTSHIAIIGVALVAVVLAEARIGSGAAKPAEQTSISIPNAPPDGALSAGSGHIYSPVALQSYISIINQDGGLLSRRAVPETILPTETRSGFITYTVQAGDNIETIAARFRLLPTTLVWSNAEVENAPDRLNIGQMIHIPPVDGIWYEVQADDTLGGIAKKFKARVEDIVNFPLNSLTAGANLFVGTKIMVPNGVKPFVAKAIETASAPSGGAYSGPAVKAAGSGRFIWPTSGILTQGYYAYHRGLDIARAIGVPVAAADGGYVSFAGWDNTGYGYMVMINHGNGFSTLYAHLNQYYVDPGQPVARGQVIAAMGRTGNSTGPHLHFEVRYNGIPQNPLFYLP